MIKQRNKLKYTLYESKLMINICYFDYSIKFWKDL